MSETPSQNPNVDPAIVLGALNEQDIEYLSQWTRSEGADELGLKHLNAAARVGDLALNQAFTHETPLYGIVTSGSEDEKVATHFVILTGDDAGTYLKNSADRLASKGLPADVHEAYRTLDDTKRTGGLINPYQAKYKEEAIVPAPAVIYEDKKEQESYLHALFAQPKEEQLQQQGVAERLKVTSESETDAVIACRYAKTDPDVQEIFDRYKGAYWREEDMPSLVRSNDELRVALGVHFLEKLRTINGMPERVARNASNNLKNPNHNGYTQKFTSHEYVALLAVSMLDGTFKSTQTKHDSIEQDKRGEIALGQHRYAAFKLLNLDQSGQVKIKYSDR